MCVWISEFHHFSLYSVTYCLTDKVFLCVSFLLFFKSFFFMNHQFGFWVVLNKAFWHSDTIASLATVFVMLPLSHRRSLLSGKKTKKHSSQSNFSFPSKTGAELVSLSWNGEKGWNHSWRHSEFTEWTLAVLPNRNWWEDRQKLQSRSMTWWN